MARLFCTESSVRRCMRRNKFDKNVKDSFFITLVNNGLPLLFFLAVVVVAAVTRSLRVTGYMIVAFALSLSLAYTLWYFVTYLIVYVLLYMKKIVQNIWSTSAYSPAPMSSTDPVDPAKKDK